jgi:hypothetical protein
LHVLQDDVGSRICCSLIRKLHKSVRIAVRAHQALHLDGIEHPLVRAVDVQGREHGGAITHPLAMSVDL